MIRQQTMVENRDSNEMDAESDEGGLKKEEIKKGKALKNIVDVRHNFLICSKWMGLSNMKK
jgi:hypothetical protein